MDHALGASGGHWRLEDASIRELGDGDTENRHEQNETSVHLLAAAENEYQDARYRNLPAKVNGETNFEVNKVEGIYKEGGV